MKKNIIVKRKNGVTMPWNGNKVKNAVRLSALTIQKDVTMDFLDQIADMTYELIQKRYAMSNSDTINVDVQNIHNAVIEVLKSTNEDIYKQYRDYRNYKQRYTKSFENIKDDTMRIVYSGDKENANKDSSIISTQKELIAGVVSQEMMVEWELPVDSKQKHKDGLIYIHDLRDHMFDSINCCIYDLENTLKDGFEMNGIQIEEPETFESFMDLAIDILLVASSQQFGGFSYSEFDRIGSKYLENTYNRILDELLDYGLQHDIAVDKAYKKTWEVCLKKCRMFEYKINSVLNATGYYGSLA